MRKTLGIILACFLLSGTLSAQTQKISLNNGWEFHEYNGSKPELAEWRSATIPGLIHTDLLANKLIPDPFYRDNENKVQWVSDAEWEYRRTIEADQNLLKNKHIDLVFEGLNTLADVSLNGNPILHSDNMFLGYRVDIKPYLKAGKNMLAIVFHRLKPEIARLQKAHPEEKEDSDTSAVARLIEATKLRSYVRKAAYEGGWDWGPNMITCGIWRPVYLQCWEDQRIMDIAIAQPDISKQAAHVNIEIRLLSTMKKDAALKVYYTQNETGKSFTYPFTLHPGVNEISYPVDIDNPRLWYPNGYGRQDMYMFKAELIKDGQITDEVSVKTGLRSVKLNKERDSMGRKFEFVVNGIPVFAKGANVIPFDHFPTRVTGERYKHYLQAMADAHMNMLRLWGGGYYESQEFYDLCDELGIMVWEDFMFANATPPSFLKESIAGEVEYQVRRLRNHPAIAIWCGNNEIGIPGQPIDPSLIPDALKPLLVMYSSYVIPPKTYFDYYATFYYLLPGIVQRLTPEIPYTPSSPTSDFEKQSADFISGDRHNYNVWWNNKDIEDQATYKDRFVSETGIQGFPDMASIDEFTQPGDHSVTSPVMNAHQKNMLLNGNMVIAKIIKTEYKDPADFTTFDYLSQLVQGESLKIYTEALRRRMPFSMGMLYWQLNDSWPVISWSTMDYYGRPKAAMYMARHFFAPVLVSPYEENDSVNIYTISDLTNDEMAILQVHLMDFNGKILWSSKADVKIKALTSQKVYSIPKDELSKAGYDPGKTFISAKLVNGKGKTISSNELYFKKPKDLNYSKSEIKTDISQEGDHYLVRISSPALAPRAYISFGSEDVWLSDNFIDVLPDEPAYISIKSSASLEKLRSTLKVISLNQL